MSSSAPAQTTVERVGGAHKNLLAWQKRAAARKLATGPVMFGEHHDRAGARAVILDLIAENSVKRLFIEVYDQIVDIDTYPSIGDFLRKNAGQDITTLEGWLALKAALDYIDRRNPNAVPLAELITKAVAAGVLVYFYDNDLSMNRVSREATKARNEVMGREFYENDGLSAGSVALAGSRHVYPTFQYDDTLQELAGVGIDRVIDLSKYVI